MMLQIQNVDKRTLYMHIIQCNINNVSYAMKQTDCNQFDSP
jgi:hypothetical protein